jgi:hypothetical protein
VQSSGDNEEMNSKMSTMLRALNVRDDLWVVVTAVLPIVARSEEDIDFDSFRENYSGVFEALGMSADSDRDLALLSGAVETSRWIVVAAEGMGVDPIKSWQNYLASMRG